jgi:hypothetical protein
VRKALCVGSDPRRLVLIQGMLDLFGLVLGADRVRAVLVPDGSTPALSSAATGESLWARPGLTLGRPPHRLRQEPIATISTPPTTNRATRAPLASGARASGAAFSLTLGLNGCMLGGIIWEEEE